MLESSAGLLPNTLSPGNRVVRFSADDIPIESYYTGRALVVGRNSLYKLHTYLLKK